MGAGNHEVEPHSTPDARHNHRQADRESFSSWAERGPAPEADWIFCRTPERRTFVTADALSHKFRRLGAVSGVDSPALHRLRHGVATHLVNQGKVLPRPRPGSDTATPQPPCGTTPTPCLSMTKRSPTNSTPCSTTARRWQSRSDLV